MGTSNSSGVKKKPEESHESDKSTNQKDVSEINVSNITYKVNEYSELGAINANIPAITIQKNHKKYDLFWLDANGNNPENNLYKEYLKDNYDNYNITTFEKLDLCIEKILELSFKELYIIVSGRLYKDFIKSFTNNLTKIKVVPKIIIFTGNKENFLDYHKNDSYMQNILNNKYYNLGGIQVDFIKVFGFLSNDNWRIRPNVKEMQDEKKETEELTFEYIDSLETLMLPRFFRTLIKLNKDDNYDELNQYLFNKYIKSEDLKELLSQIEGIPSIPLEILCKYYARMYTMESDFYNEINHNLRKESLTDRNHPIQKFVLSYVKLLYEGLKLNCFPNQCAKELYRFSFMSKSEKNKLDEYLKKKKEGLPAAICFSKAFLSFSEDKGVANVFFTARNMENEINDDLINIIFILKKNDNNSDESLRTYINISDVAKMGNEREVLFLPFSAFEIKKINPKKTESNKTYYEIELDYLDKYTDKLKLIRNNNFLKKTHFGEEISKIGIIEESKIEKNTNKALVENFYKFDKKFEENKKNIENNNYSEQIKENLNKDLIYLVKKEDIDNNGEVQILGEHIKGEDFLKLYKGKSYLIINGKKEELCYKYKLKEGINRVEIVLSEDVTNFRAMFKYCTSLIDISPLKNWDVTNLTCLSCSFRGCTSLQDLSPLKNWNISNVSDLKACFEGDTALTDLSPLENWDVSKVNLMEGTFAHCTSLSDISPLKNWNVSNAKTFHMLFEGCKNLKDISPLKNWIVGNVNNFNNIFNECSSLCDISPLKNWDVSNGISFNAFFKNCFNLKDVYSIQSWNVSKAYSFNYFFEGCVGLEDISALDNWKVSKKAAFIDFIKDTKVVSSKAPKWCPNNQ